MNESLEEVERLVKKAKKLIYSLRHYNSFFPQYRNKQVKTTCSLQLKEGKVYEFRKQNKKGTSRHS